MKGFKTNMGLFILLPGFVSVLILTYMIFFYNYSYKWTNIINVGIDGIILIYYLVNFCFEVSIGSEWIIFRTAFRRYSIKKEDFGFGVYSSILTKFVCRQRNFYILTTPRGSKLVQNLFADLDKRKD